VKDGLRDGAETVAAEEVHHNTGSLRQVTGPYTRAHEPCTSCGT
jgi:hypothetical protein